MQVIHKEESVESDEQIKEQEGSDKVLLVTFDASGLDALKIHHQKKRSYISLIILYKFYYFQKDDT